VHSEFDSDIPRKAKIVVDGSLAATIRRFSKAATELGASYVTMFDDTPALGCYEREDDSSTFELDEEARVVALELVVSKDRFFWQGFEKYSDIGFETDAIRIDDLARLGLAEG
jgi:hypothetical protein